MEFQFLKTAKSVFMKATMFTALMVFSSLFAAKANNPGPVNKEKEVSITSLGVNNGEMAFTVKCANEAEDKLSIVLSDAQGMVLYKETIGSKNLNKTFKTSTEIGTVIVTVTNTKSRLRQKFEISNEKRYVEELMITSVN
jgi:hypothetical protein